MSPSVKEMRERINNQKRNNAVKQQSDILPVELYEGVEAIVRTNNKKVRYSDLKAYLKDIFNTVADYNPVKGSVIKLSEVCDSDFDLLFEGTVKAKKNDVIIEEKIFAVV
mgnify:CR=1 FL=1|nr:MAG TPA: hypothetical protein [Caudoviricetes sp.]